MKKFKGIIKLFIFLCILAVCLFTAHNILKRKDSYVKMQDFFEQKQDFDVLYLGNSHVVNSILPMQLWKDYGIISYNIANGSERMAVSYHNLILALKYTKPKLIVIDTYLLDQKVKVDKDTFVHTAFDAYPLSYEKFTAVHDLYKNKKATGKELAFLFNFARYHSRWYELTSNDFKPIKNVQKGASARC